MPSTLGNGDLLKVVVYTSLFPSSIQPIKGNFVKERMRHVLPFAQISVVAPVPYFPPLNIRKSWYDFSRVPHQEKIGDFQLDHPRYPVIPKIGMMTHGAAMFLGSLRSMGRLVRAGCCDVIDAHYVYPDGFAAILLGKFLNKPVVVSARGSDINHFPKLPTIRPLIKRVLSQADALIAVSESLKERMVELGCPPEKIRVIGNGVDCEKFAPRSKQEMRKRLGLPESRPILISVGSLTENKGFHILLDAVARLPRRDSRLLLVIVGEGPERTRLQKQAASLGIAADVMLVGNKPHEALLEWYSAADVFCLPSAEEGWPNVVLEAMACGVPVLATRSWGRQIVTSDSLGTLIERTPEALAAAIDSAFQRDWNRDEIVRFARSHGWDAVANEVLNVLQDVATRHKRSHTA